jgi:hypothetical protein
MIGGVMALGAMLCSGLRGRSGAARAG